MFIKRKTILHQHGLELRQFGARAHTSCPVVTVKQKDTLLGDGLEGRPTVLPRSAKRR